MPYEGDSPFEAWEYWFDEPPSNFVVEILNSCLELQALSTVLEAIEITGRKALEITTETSRIQYMRGVLRHKELEQILPERAAEERNISIVKNCWDKQNYSFPLSRKYAREWLSLMDSKDLCWLIRIAPSWTRLKYLVDAVRTGVSPGDMRLLYKHAETWTDFTVLIDEVISRRSTKQ